MGDLNPKAEWAMSSEKFRELNQVMETSVTTIDAKEEEAIVVPLSSPAASENAKMWGPIQEMEMLFINANNFFKIVNNNRFFYYVYSISKSTQIFKFAFFFQIFLIFNSKSILNLDKINFLPHKKKKKKKKKKS